MTWATWLLVASGCSITVMGVLTLSGWRAEQYRRPVLAGFGAVAVGSGFVVDGLPRLLGWSIGVGAELATVGLGLVVLGSAAQVVARKGRERRRESNG